MRPLKRPPERERARWVGLKSTRNAADCISKLAADGTAIKSTHFAPAWREKQWFDAIAQSQDGLCIWCTRNPKKGGDTGDVEHIRPRTEVTRGIAEAGVEIGPRGRVQGRRLSPDPAYRGYYWLAYDPNNLAYSCNRCNSGWKQTLWPVHPWRDEASWRAPEQGVPENELVLNPFAADFDPLAHFRFGAFGIILPHERDERAEATIATLGLDRFSLCQERETLDRDLNTDLLALRRVLFDETPDSVKVQTLKRLADRCVWSSPHSAFFRSALKARLRGLELSWSDIRAAWDQRNLADDVGEPPNESWIE